MLDKTADLVGPGRGNYPDVERVFSDGHRSLHPPQKTKIALFELKDCIEKNPCKELNLIRFLPIIVSAESGVKDVLYGDAWTPHAEFHLANESDKNPVDSQIAQAVTKRKRMAPIQFNMRPGEVFITDMRAVRKDYFLDHDHSAYDDQRDWELDVSPGQRNFRFSKSVIETIRQRWLLGREPGSCRKRGGVRFDDMERICLRGAFGRFLNVTNAQESGLLPRIVFIL
jgi:aspartate--ammonia ligase